MNLTKSYTPLPADAADLQLLISLHALLATTPQLPGFTRLRPLGFREGCLILRDATGSTNPPLLAI